MIRVLVNTAANLLSGFSVVLFQILAAALIVRSVSTPEFAVWALAVSLAGFAPAFTFNLNSAVARRALLESSKNFVDGALLVAARFVAYRYLLIAIFCTIAGCLVLPKLYPEILDGASVWDSVGVGAFFIGSCWLVAAQPEQGIWIALQKNIVIALSNICARVGALAAVALAIAVTNSVPAALIFGGATLWLGFWLMRRNIELHVPLSTAISTECVESEKQLFRSVASGFAIWSVTALLYQASLVPIVGLVDAESLTKVYYVVTLTALLVGGVNALTGALIAPIGRDFAVGNLSSVRRNTAYAGFVISVGSLLFVLLLALLWEDVTRLWLGEAHAEIVTSTFWLVAGLQVVRLSAASASVLLIVKGTQQQMIGPSLIELLGLILIALPTGYSVGVEAMLIVLLLLSSLAAAWTIGIAAGICMVGKQTRLLIAWPLLLGGGFCLATVLSR